MATAAGGEASLSAFVQVVLARLASPQVAILIRGKKLDHNLLQRLTNTLCAVAAVLNDAEQRQTKDSTVNDWLDDLRDAVYVADDLFDRLCTKGATRKEVSNFFSRCFNFQHRTMVNKLEDIVRSLESILKQKDFLGLREIAREYSSWKIPSTSLVGESHIYGRDEDKEAILKLLFDDDESDGTEISVIPIVGMPGVGKTTLAQLVYDDDKVRQKFDFQAWVCVSDEFDVLKVTKSIYVGVTRSGCNINDINLLHRDLKEKLTGKKFLLVLDDVWIEDYVDWNFLISPVQSGAAGSKILVTTRSERVASVVQTSQGYHLMMLSDEDCWSVFANSACLPLGFSEDVALGKIGREIVRKCKGLPLVAKSLGGLLRGKHDMRDWNNVLYSDIWKITENGIVPALIISYHYLPSYLKRCFVYCSLYPKDYEFDKHELIFLWMAEDLLPPPKNGKTLEEVGYDYFNDLASRSFFQRSRSGNEYFVMHDLVRDLATLLGGEFYFRAEELGKETKIGIMTRHLSFSEFGDPVSENFEIFGGAKSLRTFLPINLKCAPFNNEKAPRIILSKLKYLRVLSFCNFVDLVALPDSIGELIHLRYLNLSITAINTLPESLCNLYNLQTLKLYRCRSLTMLPNDMQNLVNLLHLDIRETNLEEMPREMSKLNHLQHLSCFLVGKHEKKGIKQLGMLSNLHGSLSIAKLENVTNSSEALDARIMDKKHLEELCLQWSPRDDSTDSRSELDILSKLQPPQNLKRLNIFGYRGTRLPEWVGHPSYHNMTELSLSGCQNCYLLPSLGQLRSLKVLTVCELNMLQTIGSDFFKNGDFFSGTPFPSLERLTFYDMSSWEEWHHPLETDAFPVLKSLQIRDCPKLQGALPTYLPALENICIEGCDQLASSLPRAPAIRKLVIRESTKVALRELPFSVEDLRIQGRQVTEPVFEAMTITLPTSLQILEIKDCLSAISFLGNCLPASLKELSIRNCSKLDFPKQNQHKSLQSLCIDSSCDSLTALPLETLPNLHHLEISNCENLKSLSVSKILQNLVSFVIDGCPNFISFPREGLSAPNLTSFSVSRCLNLKSLPCDVNILLPKLEHVMINDCPKIESFPEEGMPSSLGSLDIRNCKELLRSPSLTSMDMLTHLSIEGPCDGVKSFPKEGLVLLPPSLASLELRHFPSLDTLECAGLLHLTFLQHLTISNCPRLENMAGESLPASLIKFVIYRCPLLEERCRMKHLQIWAKISHIRGIMVNKKWIS